MSHRSITQKKINRLRKLMRDRPPTQIDVVQWLMDHGHADTRGGAARIIEEDRVRVGSHIVAYRTSPKNRKEMIVLAAAVEPLVSENHA